MIDCYVMPIKSGKTRTLVERAVREIVDNESCVVYISFDDTRQYVCQLACDLLQLNDEFDAVKNRFKYLDVSRGSFNINTLAEICKMFQYEADIVIVVFVDDDSFMYERGNIKHRKEKCTFVFKSTNTEVNDYILSLLRSYIEGDIYLDTIKATKERIIEKLMLGTFLGELAENPYCSIDETAIRK